MAHPRRLGGPGYALVERALATIERYGMLRPGDTVVVAASGGPDSTCLVDVLARVPLELGLHLAHVDHGLSEESANVARAVASGAARAGFDVHVMKAPDLGGPNLQARARELRYSFLRAIAAEVDAARVATGHTLDDRVETTLGRLVHGAGSDGLAGIPPAEGATIRPLIEVRRRDTRAYCDELSLTYFDDPANSDPRFDRTAIRHTLVAAIESRWGEGAVRAMATSAERLWEDARALATLADRVYAELAGTQAEGVSFDADSLLALPRALRRRLLERAVGRVRDRSGGIDAALDALESERERSKRFAVASGFEIKVDRTEVSVSGPSSRREPAGDGAE
jgi:tRNA(Ile)-lysidine synthase